MAAITVVFGCYEHSLFGYELEAADEDRDEDAEPLEMKQVFSYAPHLGAVKSVASSGKVLVSGGSDEVINIYDLKKLKEVGKLQNHKGSITVVAFTGKNNTHMISGSEDGVMCLWKIKDWSCLQTIHVHNGSVISLALHPSSRLALSVGTDNQLKIWNLLTGKLATTLPLAHTPSQVLFNPSGSLFSVVFPDSKKILVHNLDGSLLRTLEYPHKLLTSVFLNDHTIAAAGEEGSIGVWDTGKGFQYAINLFSEQVKIIEEEEKKEVSSIPRIKTIAVLPKINHLIKSKNSKETLPYVVIGCSNGLVVILNLSDGSILATVQTEARLTCLTVTEVVKTETLPTNSNKRKQTDSKVDADSDSEAGSDNDSDNDNEEAEGVDKVTIAKESKKGKPTNNKPTKENNNSTNNKTKKPHATAASRKETNKDNKTKDTKTKSTENKAKDSKPTKDNKSTDNKNRDNKAKSKNTKPNTPEENNKDKKETNTNNKTKKARTK